VKKYLKGSLLVVVMGIIGFAIYILIGLSSFSEMTNSDLILLLDNKGTRYEMFYVWGGSTGSDVLQTRIDGVIYSNNKMNLNNLTIKSVNIRDSITIILEDGDNQDTYISIPLDSQVKQ